MRKTKLFHMLWCLVIISMLMGCGQSNDPSNWEKLKDDLPDQSVIEIRGQVEGFTKSFCLTEEETQAFVSWLYEVKGTETNFSEVFAGILCTYQVVFPEKTIEICGTGGRDANDGTEIAAIAIDGRIFRVSKEDREKLDAFCTPYSNIGEGKQQ